MDGLRWLTFLVLVSILVTSVRCQDDTTEEECLEMTECEDSHQNESDRFLLFCYFTNWAWNRKSPANFHPENINASLCTHILYAFAYLDANSLSLVPSDSLTDIDNGFYKGVVAHKEQGTKVLLSCGGWTNSAKGPWSQMMSTNSSRKVFIESALDLLNTYGFDGLDFDYEFPGCPQFEFVAAILDPPYWNELNFFTQRQDCDTLFGNTSNALPDDKSNFNLLLSELKESFREMGYLVTVATAGWKSKIDDCFKMTSLCANVDMVSVMALEYNNYQGGVTGANAPLCGTNGSFGVYETMDYYLNTLGCPPEKLLIGIPFYGASFTLADTSSEPKFGDAVTGPGEVGPYNTLSAGLVSYMEIGQYIKDSNYTVGYDSINNDYAWKDNQFFSFDGQATIAKKACLIKNLGVAGAMMWTLDFDDFNNMNGRGSYPLLEQLNYELDRTTTRPEDTF